MALNFCSIEKRRSVFGEDVDKSLTDCITQVTFDTTYNRPKSHNAK